MFTKTKFASFDLIDNLQKGIDNLGWEYVTQVQKETIPLALAGRDVIGQARTGSGKTAGGACRAKASPSASFNLDKSE